MKETPFDRYYTSDLPRAVQTAQIVLNEARCDDNDAVTSSLVLDNRLREIAKGAREGFSKSVTYEEALQLRRISDPGDSSLPLCETEVEAWQRMYSLICGWVEEAVAEQSHSSNAQPCRHVFCMSHSGILRVFLRRLIGDERLHSHPNARFDPTGLFYIPNTSATILDVGLQSKSVTDDSSTAQHSIQEQQKRSDHNLDVDIIELTWADHLGKDAATSFAE